MAGISIKGLQSAYKAIDRYAVKPIEKEFSSASMVGARVAARLIRAETPEGETRDLYRSVRARRGQRGLRNVLRGGEIGVALAGPTARHRHLVIRGHRIVTPGGRDTGRRARVNPFVDRAVESGWHQIAEAVQHEFFKRR